MLPPVTSAARNLIIANAMTLIAAVIFEWPLGWLLWPYWIQSVVIGAYARKRMLNLDRFSTDGFTANDQPVPENENGKRKTARFFVVHYGFFHLGYLMFLQAMSPVRSWYDLAIMLLCGVSFVLSQRATYAVQHAADLRGTPHLGKMMFTPYLRVLPIHLAIIFGGMLGEYAGFGALLLFTALKTLSDIKLDAIDRRNAETPSHSGKSAEG